MSNELLEGLQAAERHLSATLALINSLKTKVPIEMTPDPQPPTQTQPSSVRRSAGVDRLHIQVQRVSTPAKVWRLTDLWTTVNGSWEPSTSVYSVPAWAINEFAPLFPMTGGDHNIYAIMLKDGVPTKTEKMKLWHNHGAFIKEAKSAGYFEQDIFGSFDPDRGERGGWSVAPQYPVADVVNGMGLPLNHHVSLFCVWRWIG